MATTVHPKPSRPAPPPPQTANTPIDAAFVTDSRNSQRDIEKDYTLGEQLGLPGQYGHALLATRLSDNHKVAIKVISKLKFNNLRERNVHMSELRTEISILRKLDHPHIIKMYDTYETYSHLYIVTEVCTGGELFDAIKLKGNYNEQDAAHVLQQICSGLAYMHKQGVAHCDLKPDNFLFSDKSPNSALKIIDFGMSKFVKRRHFFRSLRGTPYYIAPEVLQGHYNNSADMWSVGVVMFVMLFGYPPFAADTDDGIFDLISQGFNPVVKKGYKAHFPADLPVSEPARDLLTKLLTSDVATRLTADEALDHPWLRGEASTQPLVSNVIDNLRQFVGANKLKQKVLDMMATSLDQHELQHLQQQFQHIDMNNDGIITLDELQQSLSNDKVSMDNTEVKKLFDAADVDGDGVLNYGELLKISVHRKISAKEERLYNAFRQIDLNRDGRLSLQELENVLQSNHSDALQMLQDADVDNDGTIDFDEFASVFEQHSEQLATKQLTALGVQPKQETPSNKSQNATDDVSRATQTLSLTGNNSNNNDHPTHVTSNNNDQVTIQQHSPSVTTQSKSSPTSKPQPSASHSSNYQEKNDRSKNSGMRRKRSNLDKCSIS